MLKQIVCTAVVIVACVLALEVHSSATEGPPESVTEAIVNGSWEVWDRLVRENTNATKAISKALRVVAEDDKRDNEERIHAVVLLGKTASEEEIEFLLANIDLKLAKRYFHKDDDEEKQHPCWYALKSMGWRVVPHALEFIEEKRTPKELELVARVLARVCRAKVAKAILETKLQEAEEARDNPVRERNLRQLLSQPLRGAEG